MCSPGSKMRLLGGIVAMLAGTALLGIATLGEWSPLAGGYGSPKRDWERFDPSLVGKLPDYPSLSAAVKERLAGDGLSNAAQVQVIYDLLVDRFTHDEAAHTLWSNWILYAAGFIHHTFWHVWSTDRYVSHGHSLLCDQASYLMVQLAREHGFKARQIGLQGHVVMEVWYDGNWHLYDPDLEVIPIDATGRVLSLVDLSKDDVLRQQYYGRHSNMADLVKHRENFLYMSMPEGARFEWKGNLLALLERICDWLKFLIPVGMIVLGWRLLKSRPPRAEAP